MDSHWQLVFIGNEMRANFGDDVPLPTPFLGEPWLSAQMAVSLGANTVNHVAEIAAGVGGLMLRDIGPDGVRALVDPRLCETVVQ